MVNKILNEFNNFIQLKHKILHLNLVNVRQPDKINMLEIIPFHL